MSATMKLLDRLLVNPILIERTAFPNTLSIFPVIDVKKDLQLVVAPQRLAGTILCEAPVSIRKGIW